jgi:hypothetical protein
MTQNTFAESAKSAAAELEAAAGTIIQKYNALDPKSKNALRLRKAIARLRLEITHLSEADWQDEGETYGVIEDMLSAIYDIGRSYRALDADYWLDATADTLSEELGTGIGEGMRQDFFDLRDTLWIDAENWLIASDTKSLEEVAEATAS